MLTPLLLNNLLTEDAGVSASATVTGTASLGLSEWRVEYGGATIVLTLTGTTWVSLGATFDAQRQAIINGISSAQSETTGWNTEVRDNEVVGSVVRNSDTVVTITLTAAADYEVTANEVITITIPGASIAAGSPITVLPSITVTADVEVPDSTFGDYGALVTNSQAEAYPSYYLICDRSGFKVKPSEGLKEEWNGLMVRASDWEARHPQDLIRGKPEQQKGSPRPEQTDVHLSIGDVTVDDL